MGVDWDSGSDGVRQVPCKPFSPLNENVGLRLEHGMR